MGDSGSPRPAGEFKYWAFISYSHRDNRDEGNRWGDWLLEAIEGFQVPDQLVGKVGRYGQTVPARLFPCFQDEKELPTDSSLDSAIQEALVASRYLVVICSPHAARSKYVNREILEFKRLGRSNRILALIVEGEPNASDPTKGFDPEIECFPKALRHPLGANGDLDEARIVEPIGADLRGERGKQISLKDPSKAHALERELLRTAAGLLGVGFDELVQRDKERQLAAAKARARRLRFIAAGFGALSLAAMAMGWIAWRQKKATVESFARADFLQAVQFVSEGKNSDALPHLARSLRLKPAGNPASDLAFTLIASETWPYPQAILAGHQREIYHADFSPDGSRIVTTSADHTARLWDAKTGAAIGEPMLHSGVVFTAQFRSDSSRLLTGAMDTIGVWDAANGKSILYPIAAPGWNTNVAYSSDGTTILSHESGTPGGVWLRDAKTGKPEPLTFATTLGLSIEDLTWDGKKAVTLSVHHEGQVWDIASGKPLCPPFAGSRDIISANFTPDGSRVVADFGLVDVKSGTSRAQLFDATTGKAVGSPIDYTGIGLQSVYSPDGTRFTVFGHNNFSIFTTNGEAVGKPFTGSGPAQFFLFSRDGSKIAVATASKTIDVWEVSTGRPLLSPLSIPSGISGILFNADGTQLIVGSSDGSARIWSIPAAQPLAEPFQHPSGVGWMSYSPDGSQILTTGANVGYLWNAKLAPPSGLAFLCPSTVTAAVLSPDGSHLATYDGALRIWSPLAGQSQTIASIPFMAGDMPNPSLAFSPDGTLVVMKDAFSPKIFYAATGKDAYPDLKFSGFGSRSHLAVNTDSSKLAISGCEDLSGKGSFEIADSRTGRISVGPTQLSSAIDWLSFGPGDRELFILCGATLRKWDVQTGREVGSAIALGQWVGHAVLSPDGARIGTAGGIDGRNAACVWDLATGRAITAPMPHQGTLNWIAFSPDGKRVVTAADDMTARVWDAATGAPLAGPVQHQGAIRTATFSPDGSQFVTASDDGTARLWNASTGAAVGSPMSHQGKVVCAVFSPNGTLVATASADKTARIWKAASGDPVTEPFVHPNAVSAVAFSPNGSSVATLSDDGMARLWSSSDGHRMSPVFEAGNFPSGLFFSPEGDRLITQSSDGVRTWDTRNGDQLYPPFHHRQVTMSSAFSTTGALLATGSLDNTARVWSLATCQPVTPSLIHPDSVQQVVLSPDGSKLTTLCQDQMMRIWDVKTAALLGAPVKASLQLHSARFSPDGKKLLVALDDEAQILDPASGKPICPPLRHFDVVSEAVFSPDGLRVATVSADQTARVWDSTTGKALTDSLRHPQAVTSATFSPDGLTLATVCSDNELRIWDIETGQLSAPPLPHATRDASFSPDGRLVVTGSDDATCRIRSLSPGRKIPDWLPDLIEVAAQRHFDPRGATLSVDSVEINRVKSEVLASPGKQSWTQFGLWFFADPASRTGSPWGSGAKAPAN